MPGVGFVALSDARSALDPCGAGWLSLQSASTVGLRTWGRSRCGVRKSLLSVAGAASGARGGNFADCEV